MGKTTFGNILCPFKHSRTDLYRSSYFSQACLGGGGGVAPSLPSEMFSTGDFISQQVSVTSGPVSRLGALGASTSSETSTLHHLDYMTLAVAQSLIPNKQLELLSPSTTYPLLQQLKGCKLE